MTMREGSRLPQPKKCDIGPASPAIPSCQMGMHRARNRNNGGSLSKLPHASKGREHFSENFKVLPNRQRPNLYQNLEAFLLSEPGQHTSRLFCIRVGIFQIKTLKHRATTTPQKCTSTMQTRVLGARSATFQLFVVLPLFGLYACMVAGNMVGTRSARLPQTDTKVAPSPIDSLS